MRATGEQRETRRIEQEEDVGQLPNRNWLARPQKLTVLFVAVAVGLILLVLANQVFTGGGKKEEPVKAKIDQGGQPFHRTELPKPVQTETFPAVFSVPPIGEVALPKTPSKPKGNGGSLFAFAAENPNDAANKAGKAAAAHEEDEDRRPQTDDNDPLSNTLRVSNTGKTAKAHILKHPRTTIPRGTAIPCKLETQINTSRPGLVVCHSTREVRGWGDAGVVMLLPRWTQFTGQISQGLTVDQDRVDVLWTTVLTPDNIEIEVHSPAADMLGAPGVPGQVDNHVLEKIGAVLLYTVLEAGPALAVQALENQGRNQGNNNNGFYNYNLTGVYQPTQNVAGRLLDRKLNRPPILIKNQGEEVTVIVAQNWDLSNVIGLEAVR